MRYLFVSILVVACSGALRSAAQAQSAAQADATKQADALVAYRRQHPVRRNVAVQCDGFLLGLGHATGAAVTTLTVGLGLQRDLRPGLTARLDLLGRIGEGAINDWSFDGALHTKTGLVGGAELHGELLVRPNAFYLGPAFSVGFLRLASRELIGSADDWERAHVVHVPGLAAYVVAGLALGVESTPEGGMGVGLRIMGGVWNDMRHPYLQLSLNLTFKVWD
jgi:hypothetical protein